VQTCVCPLRTAFPVGQLVTVAELTATPDVRRTRARSSPVQAPLPKRRRGAVEISRRTGETGSLDSAKARRATAVKRRHIVTITLSPTLGQARLRQRAGAAICVQDVDVQCVLQFTLIHAAGCALHRRTSRVIHRIELCLHTTRASRHSQMRFERAAGHRRNTGGALAPVFGPLPGLIMDWNSRYRYSRTIICEKFGRGCNARKMAVHKGSPCLVPRVTWPFPAPSRHI
jgi:hypothetical protein